MSSVWRIRLLGGLTVEADDRVIERFKRHATRAVLAYLAYYVDRSHSREKLIDLLWPESDAIAGRQNLSQSLSGLRRELWRAGPGSEEVILADRLTVRLNPASVTTDVAEFNAALLSAGHAHNPADRVERLSRAVAEYRGELLPGFYDEWIAPERESLTESYLKALGQLVELRKVSGDLEGAVEYARRALRTDPVQETAHQRLIHLYGAMGWPTQARRQFQELERILKEEFGVEPSASSRALVDTSLALPVSPPPPRPASPPANNLPVQFTSFIGRASAVAEVKGLLAATQLLTLTGTGGCGKSRLALETAAGLVEQYPDGVWLVELAPVVDPALVPEVIARALDVREVSGQHLLESVRNFVRDRNMLLVIDNFEHVLDAAPFVAKLLSKSKGLKVLVTSREALRLRGEQEFLVLPLALPDLEQPCPVETVAPAAAVELFVQRARSVQPSFTLTPDNARAVAEICCRLDGLPLAIELAASRIKLFSPQPMLQRLTGMPGASSLRVLTEGARDLPPRHRTLRSAIAWSYDLLEAPNKALFRHLAVFVGGCSLEAAKAVCCSEIGDLTVGPIARVAGPCGSVADDFLDGIASLVDKSLLQTVNPPDHDPRFALLETLRDFGLECLEADGDGDTVRSRHAAFFLDLAEEAEPHLHGPEQLAWLEMMEREIDNLRAALAWAQAPDQDAELGLRLAGALYWFWHLRSHLSEGRRWTEAALARSPTDRTPARAKALLGAGEMAHYQADYRSAVALLSESSSIYRDKGDPAAEARASIYEPFAALRFGGIDLGAATARLEECVRVLRRHGERWGLAMGLFILGATLLTWERDDSARPYLEESVALFRELGDRWGLAAPLWHLGFIHQRRGDAALAFQALTESLVLVREVGDRGRTAVILDRLGELALQQGDVCQSKTAFVEALKLWEEVGDRQFAAGAHLNLGHVARTEANLGLAHQHYKESLAHHNTLEHGASVWLSIEAFASLAAARGMFVRAARLFGAAAVASEKVPRSVIDPSCPHSARDLVVVRAALGEGAYAVAWAEGRSMTLEEAVRLVLDDTPST